MANKYTQTRDVLNRFETGKFTEAELDNILKRNPHISNLEELIEGLRIQCYHFSYVNNKTHAQSLFRDITKNFSQEQLEIVADINDISIEDLPYEVLRIMEKYEIIKKHRDNFEKECDKLRNGYYFDLMGAFKLAEETKENQRQELMEKGFI